MRLLLSTASIGIDRNELGFAAGIDRLDHHGIVGTGKRPEAGDGRCGDRTVWGSESEMPHTPWRITI